MSSKLSLSRAILCCDTVEPAMLNDRSLVALDAGIDRISLATVDKRGSEDELTRQSPPVQNVVVWLLLNFLLQIRCHLVLGNVTQRKKRPARQGY